MLCPLSLASSPGPVRPRDKATLSPTITVIITLRSVDQVSALLVQSNSHDIGNEKGCKKFNFQVLWKLEIEFTLEFDFWFSVLLVGPFHSFQLNEGMTQSKPIFILNAACNTFLFLNSNIQSADIVAGQSNTVGTACILSHMRVAMATLTLEYPSVSLS